MSKRDRIRGANLYEFRDLDLMAKLKAEANGNPEGWVETDAMAEALGFEDDRLPIAQRLSWMRRFGMVEFDKPRRMWRLTDGGERVTAARLQAAQAREIEDLPDEVMVEVMAKVTQRYYLGSPMLATMLRREFLFGTKPR
jgi:hypothetical protein